MRTGSSRNSLENRFVSNLGEVSTLDLGGDTGKSPSERVLGRGVDHLASDRSGIGRPGEEDKLGSLTLTAGDLVLKVVDGVSAVVLGQLAEEGVVRVGGSLLLDNNLGLGIVDLVNDEGDLLAELELVESLEGRVVNGNTGSGLS